MSISDAFDVLTPVQAQFNDLKASRVQTKKHSCYLKKLTF